MSLAAVLQPVLLPVLRSPFEAGFAFNPRSLFAAGEQGVIFDSSDFSTMFQDSTGTTPVTAVGQPVGKILDKSGRGNHATQATAPNRPILQQDANGHYYLAFNGANSSLATGSINFTGTDKVTLTAGITKSSDAALGFVCELSASTSANNGAFYLDAPNGAGPSLVFSSKGTSQSIGIVSSGYPAPITAVLGGIGDISGNLAQLRVNGSLVANPVTSQGTGTYGNYPLYIGVRGGSSGFFNGRFYGLIVRGAASSETQIVQAETWMNRRTGAY